MNAPHDPPPTYTLLYFLLYPHIPHRSYLLTPHSSPHATHCFPAPHSTTFRSPCPPLPAPLPLPPITPNALTFPCTKSDCRCCVFGRHSVELCFPTTLCGEQ